MHTRNCSGVARKVARKSARVDCSEVRRKRARARCSGVGRASGSEVARASVRETVA